MTRDEEYISKYLEDNYYLVADRTFIYRDKQDERNKTEQEVKHQLLLVFGNFVGLNQIFTNWSEYHKNIIIKGLIDYFDTLDLSLGSYFLSQKIVLEEKFSSSYKREFLMSEFENYYISRVYDDLMMNSMAKLEDSNLEYHSSSNLISRIIDGSVKEVNSITDKIKLKINEWYYDNVFKSKLDEFFSQCWLSLGETNWVVKHPMYGTFDEKTIMIIFNGETDYQKSILRKRFDHWYEENIYDASERAVKNLYL